MASRFRRIADDFNRITDPLVPYISPADMTPRTGAISGVTLSTILLATTYLSNDRKQFSAEGLVYFSVLTPLVITTYLSGVGFISSRIRRYLSRRR